MAHGARQRTQWVNTRSPAAARSPIVRAVSSRTNAALGLSAAVVSMRPTVWCSTPCGTSSVPIRHSDTTTVAPPSTASAMPPTLPNQAPSSSTKRARHRPVVEVVDARPAVRVGPAAADGEAGHRVEVGGGERRFAVDPPAVEAAAPGERDGGRPPAGAEQRAGDGGDGVGVATGTGDAPQRRGEVVAGEGVRFVGGRRDRRQRRLEGGDDPPVVVMEVGRVAPGCLVDAGAPQVAATGVDVVEPGGDGGDPVERLVGACRGDRPFDGQRPQHACLDAVGVRVGQLGDGGGQPGDGVTVAERGEGDRAGAHQRPVAGGVGPALLERLGGGARRRTVAGGVAEHGAGLVADVARSAGVPADHLGADRLGVGVPLGEDRENGERHLRVVGPLAGLPTEVTTTFELARCVRVRRVELVGRAEGVASGRRHHRPDGAVDRRRVERCPRPGVAQPCSSASLRPPQKSSLSRWRSWRDLPRHSLTVRSRPL